jgi:hypothetical protein
MSFTLTKCDCGRFKSSSVTMCDICDAERVAKIQRVHERPRRLSLDERLTPVGVVSYRPHDAKIIASINANAARAARRRRFARSPLGRVLGLLGVRP